MVREQAAQFILEDNTGSATRDAHQQHWLSDSPKHVEELLRMDALWEALADPDLAPALYKPRPGRRFARVRRIGLAGAAAVLLGVAVSTWWLATRPDVYRTAVGEVTSFQLADRSVIFMNAASELSVRYRPDARLVELRSGEAAFDVARDEERPFVVDTGTSRVVVLGTRFVVRRNAEETAVTVIEGRVMVEGDLDLVRARRRTSLNGPPSRLLAPRRCRPHRLPEPSSSPHGSA